MICERCHDNFPVLIRCEITLKTGGNDRTLRCFNVCPECADRAGVLLIEAIGDTILDVNYRPHLRPQE